MPTVTMTLRIDEKLKRDLQALCRCFDYSLHSWLENELQCLVDAGKAALPRELNEARAKLRHYNELSMKLLELEPDEGIERKDLDDSMTVKAEMSGAVAKPYANGHVGGLESDRDPDCSFKQRYCHERAELGRDFVEKQLEAAKREYDKLRQLAEFLADETLPGADIVDEYGILTATTRERIYAVAGVLDVYAGDLGAEFGYGDLSLTWEKVLNRRIAIAPSIRRRISTWLERKEEELAESLSGHLPAELKKYFGAFRDDSPDGGSG